MDEYLGDPDGMADRCFVYYVENGKIKKEVVGSSADDGYVGYTDQSLGEKRFRLCFKLKDELPIISGTGEQDTPYQLVETE